MWTILTAPFTGASAGHACRGFSGKEGRDYRLFLGRSEKTDYPRGLGRIEDSGVEEAFVVF